MTAIADGVTSVSLLWVLAYVLAVGLSLQPVVVRVMTAASVLDVPSARSSHTVPTPRAGGVAVVLAGMAGLMFDPATRVLVVPLLSFAAIGLAEDLRGLSIRSRLLLQVLAGTASAVLVLPGAPVTAGAAVIGLAVVWLVAYANVFNFMDGVNGISAVHAMVGGAAFAVVGVLHAMPALVIAGAVAVAAAATFLPWNAGRAHIFLGDVGSYGLGGLLGALTVFSVSRGVPVEAAIAPLALYLADTGWTLVRRIYRREAWYLPHRTHAYQRLTDAGWTHQRVTAATAIVSTAVCGLLITASQEEPFSRIALDAVALLMLVAYLASAPMLAERTGIHV